MDGGLDRVRRLECRKDELLAFLRASLLRAHSVVGGGGGGALAVLPRRGDRRSVGDCVLPRRGDRRSAGDCVTLLLPP